MWHFLESATIYVNSTGSGHLGLAEIGGADSGISCCAADYDDDENVKILQKLRICWYIRM